MKKSLFLIIPFGMLLFLLLFVSFDEKDPAFQLTDPEVAPDPLKKEVLYGYQLMMHTAKLLPNNVGDRLNCTNCHFNGGDTTGGKNGGIPLAGIAALYPAYNSRSEKVIDLPTRINSCFERSMNGKRLDNESREMIALLTYLQWISKDYPIYRAVPWRGLAAIKSTVKPDSTQGKMVYKTYCASCHGLDGQGKNEEVTQVPALWGKGSFNSGAGMSDVSTLAAFIHANMPLRLPELSEEEALHVAAFILEQPRSRFEK